MMIKRLRSLLAVKVIRWGVSLKVQVYSTILMNNCIDNDKVDNLSIVLTPPPLSLDLSGSRLSALRSTNLNPDVGLNSNPSLSTQLTQLSENYNSYPFVRDLPGLGFPRFGEPFRYSTLHPPELERSVQSGQPHSVPVQGLEQIYEPSFSDALFSYSFFILCVLVFLSVMLFLLALVATYYEKPLTGFFKLFRIIVDIFRLYNNFRVQQLGPLERLVASHPILEGFRTVPDSFLARFSSNLSWFSGGIADFLYRNGLCSVAAVIGLSFGPFFFKQRKRFIAFLKRLFGC